LAIRTDGICLIASTRNSNCCESAQIWPLDADSVPRQSIHAMRPRLLGDAPWPSAEATSGLS
jgi:hypothetical protein